MLCMSDNAPVIDPIEIAIELLGKAQNVPFGQAN